MTRLHPHARALAAGLLRWRGDRVVRGALTLLGASFLAHGLTLVAMPVLTRLVTPDAFGQFAAFVSVVSVLLPVASLRFEWAVPLARDPSECAALVKLSFTVLLVVTALVAALSGLLVPHTALHSYRTVSRVPVELYLGAGVAILGTVQIVQSWVLRTGEFPLLAKCRVAHSALVAGSQASLAALSPGAHALIFGFLGGQAFAYWPLLNDLARRTRASRGVAMSVVANRYRRFPTLSAPSSLINSLGVEAPLLLIGALMGAAAAGQYALALRVASVPGMLATQTLGQSFYSEAARLASENPRDLRLLYRRTIAQLALSAVPVCVVLLAAPWYFPWLFGAQWESAGRMSAWLSLLVFSQMAFGTVSCLEYLGRQFVNLLWNLGRLAVVTSLVGLAFWAGLDSVAAVAVLSVGSSVWYPVLLGLNERSLSHSISVPAGGVSA